MVLRIVVTAAAVLLVAGIQLIAGFTGRPAVILISGALMCLISYGLWALLEKESKRNQDLFLPGGAAVTGVLLGSIPRWLSLASEELVVDLLAVILAGIACGLIVLFRLYRRSRSCGLCSQHLSRVFHVCPRCKKAVCARSRCWNAKYYRCSDCDGLRRPLLTLNDESWWLQRLGSRITSGRCRQCGLGADQCDLRKCGQCPWALCAQCWDTENGRCVRCFWVMQQLPESLEPYMSTEDLLQPGEREEARTGI